MKRFVRDFGIAVAGAVVGGAIMLWKTNLTHIQLIIVSSAVLVSLILVLTSFRMPTMIKRRYRVFRDALSAEAKEQILAELAAQVPPSTKPANAGAILRAAQASARAQQRQNLADLTERGRMLLGRVRYSNPVNTSDPGGLSSEIGDWEGRARTAIKANGACLEEFNHAPDVGQVVTVGRALARIEHQIAAVDRAEREFDQVPAS